MKDKIKLNYFHIKLSAYGNKLKTKGAIS